MGISVSTSKQQITASVTDDAVSATVSGGPGATGPQGPSGQAGLPAGTEGYVLTYVSGSWTAAAPASGYTLPTATASVLGGVKIGAGVTITDGVISVSTNYAAATHTHGISDVTGLQTALDGKQASGSYAAAVHTHGISDVTGLQTALDGKQASGSYAAATHTHAIGDVSGLQTALDGKAASSHPHGNITNAGAIGSTSGQIVVTGASGVLTTAATISSSAVSGLGGAATLNVGTTAGTVAAGDHTHTQLHDRSHAITSSSDHTATAWRVFYANGSGVVTELALGASGTVLTSGGASAAPTFSALPAGGTKSYALFSAMDNQPPSSNFATLDTRNSVAVLDFDDATKETSVFVSVMPEAASLGSGLTIRLHWMATTATSGAVRWEVSIERSNTDLDSDSFDTVATGSTTTNGTSGILSVTEITLTTIDSVAAGDVYRVRVARDAANAADTLSGDAELVAVEVRSAA